MNDEQTKAIKALEAAVRKARRAGIAVRMNYSLQLDDGAGVNMTIHEGDNT